MHAPRNFSLSVFLLALALTAGMAPMANTAQAAPQAAAPAVVHRAAVHHAAPQRYVRRRYIRRRYFVRAAAVRPAAVRPAAVRRVIVQPASAIPATVPVKVVAAAQPVKIVAAAQPIKIVAAVAPAVSKPAAQAAPKPAVLTASAPDYGGRESAPLTTAGDAAPNPAAQAGRALGALVLVLAGVVGVVYILKRFNLVRPGASGKPARIAGPSFGRPFTSQTADVAVISSQSLPGGTMLHVVRVDGRNLLLAATAQSVTTVAEWNAPETDSLSAADEFEGYLARADAHSASSGIAAANARLRSLLASAKPEEPS